MRLYIEKVETSLAEKNDNQGNLKEEAFRFVLTLHSLLENPPGDFSDELREDIVKGFVQIFSFVRYINNWPAWLHFMCYFMYVVSPFAVDHD